MTQKAFKTAKSLTITYLTPVSFASLNGSDKEADNISSIKKISVGTNQFPYLSSQAVRRALRTQLGVLGCELSEGVVSEIEKGAATTKQDPVAYIDDDLFGYMGTSQGVDGKKGKATKRTSPIRVSPLIALTPYEGDLDFGTNYMGVKEGGDPNIFETEIHAGLYRGTILIELDRIGSGDGFSTDIASGAKKERVKLFVQALKNLWSSGRQTRFLSDISPKFIAAAILKTKNPVYLESVRILPQNEIQIEMLKEVENDFAEEIIASIYGVRSGIFSNVPQSSEFTSIGDAFSEINNWIDSHYQS